jgi:signal transduction histidine kinase
LLDIEKGSN